MWLGNQTAAGILMPYEEKDAEGALRKKAASLAALRSRRITTIICCSQDDDDDGGEPFKEDGLVYLVGAPRGSLHAGRSTRAAPRGGRRSFFYSDVRSILMVLC